MSARVATRLERTAALGTADKEGHAEAGSSGGGCVSLLRNSSVTVVTVECAGAPTDRPTCGRVECDECGTDRPTRWEECGTGVGDSVTVRGAGLIDAKRCRLAGALWVDGSRSLVR